jgi:hypothetical protein
MPVDECRQRESKYKPRDGEGQASQADQVLIPSGFALRTFVAHATKVRSIGGALWCEFTG